MSHHSLDRFLLPIFSLAQQQCDEPHSFSLSIALNLHLMSSAHQIKQECLAYCSVKRSIQYCDYFTSIFLEVF